MEEGEEDESPSSYSPPIMTPIIQSNDDKPLLTSLGKWRLVEGRHLTN